MPSGRSAPLLEFARVESRAVVASFDGGRMTSDAGALLLGAADRTRRRRRGADQGLSRVPDHQPRQRAALHRVRS